MNGADAPTRMDPWHPWASRQESGVLRAADIDVVVVDVVIIASTTWGRGRGGRCA
jgi:hypothetical protein